MDSFEFTKIAGAVLAALLLIFGAKTAIETNVGHEPAKPGYTLPEPAAIAAAPAADGAAPATASANFGADTVALLAKANADNGKAVFARCKACHVVEKGKPNTVGPNLWGIVNRRKGSAEGYGYSEALKTKGGEWTYEDLANFLHNPKGYVAGTKMAFAGLAAPAETADVIAYLAAQSDTPAAPPK